MVAEDRVHAVHRRIVLVRREEVAPQLVRAAAERDPVLLVEHLTNVEAPRAAVTHGAHIHMGPCSVFGRGIVATGGARRRDRFLASAACAGGFAANQESFARSSRSAAGGKERS